MAVATGAALVQTVDVSLGDRSYPIYIGQGLLDRSDLLQQHIPGKKVLIVTNKTVAPLYLERSAFMTNTAYEAESRSQAAQQPQYATPILHPVLQFSACHAGVWPL